MDQSSSFASNQPFPSVIIAELSDLSKRIRAENIAAKNFKFLCLSVSNSFLAIGCSTGLVLLFHRFTRKIIKNDDPAEVEILATEASPVVKISLSPNECHLAYGTSDCFVHLLNLKNYTANNIPLFKVKLTDCNQLTTFCWKHDSSELYVGCKSGAVYILTNKINSNEGFVKFFLHLDSSVIQLDECDNLLFISTRHQNLIFNTSNFSLTEFGNWHKRANCGACAWKADFSTSLNVVAARRRGKFCFSLKHPVDNALHFYQPKCVIFCKIIQPNQPFEIWYDEDWRFITFQRLHIFKKKFLISILNRHICIVDFSSLADLIFAYSLGSKEVLSYDISGDDVFLLQTDGTVRKFTIILLNDICNALEKLFASNCFSAAADLTVHFIKQNQKLPCSMNKFKEMLNCVKEDVHGLQIELCKKMFMLKELTSSTNWQIHPNHASTDGNEDLLQYGDLLMIKNSQGSQCSQCGIHGSWIFMMTFGIAAKRVRFANNYFLRGGVPVCADDWKLLFDIRKCTSNKMQPTLCGRCTSLASTVKALFENPNRLLNLMEFYQQNNNQHIDWWSESASSREIVDKSSGSKSKVEQFRWLDGFPIEALLWICVKTVGLESLCQLVDRNDKIERQLPLNWYPLLLLASLNSNAWFLSDRILALLASSLFNLEIAVCKQVTMRTFPVFLRSDSLCPICTLPALNSVSETGQEYVIFACCGSAYHAVCLNGTFENAISEFACLVCRREHSSGVE